MSSGSRPGPVVKANGIFHMASFLSRVDVIDCPKTFHTLRIVFGGESIK